MKPQDNKKPTYCDGINEFYSFLTTVKSKSRYEFVRLMTFYNNNEFTSYPLGFRVICDYQEVKVVFISQIFNHVNPLEQFKNSHLY